SLRPLQCEFRVVHLDGGVQWLETRAAPESLADGGTLWHGFTAVVTERKLAELDLRRRKDLWEMAAAAAGLGTGRFDLAAGPRSLDHQACWIHGLDDCGRVLTLDEWLQAILPEDRGPLASGLQQTAGPCERLHARYRVPSGNGEHAVLELHARK